MLATLATWGRDESIPVVVVTGDRDTFQLVEDPFVKVLYNRRGVSDYSLYDEAGIFERCGIESRALPAARRAARRHVGQPARRAGRGGEDRGEALRPVPRHGRPLRAPRATSRPKLRENLATYEERARNNEKVMRLIRDVPLEFTLHDITLGGWDRAEIDAFFDRFEMNQMRTRFGQLLKEGLLGDAGASAAPLREATEVKKTTTAKALTVAASLDEVLGSTTTPVVAYRHARAAVLDADKGLVALCDLDDAIAAFARVAPCGHDLKALYREAASTERVLLEPADDTAIMAFLLDANSGRYDLAEVAQRFLGEPIVDSSPSLFDSTTSDETLTYEVALIGRLREHLRAEIAQWELTFVYEQIELPLVMVLGLMEARGIRVDVELLRTISQGVHRRGRVTRRRDPTGRRSRVQGELAPATPDGALRRTGTHGGEEDQVRVLDRRREPRGDRGRAQDRRR